MSDLIIKEEDIKKEESRDVAAGLDEYEQSAAMFNHLSQVFRKELYKLANRKKRAAPRVLEALLFEPLESVQLSGKEEKNLLEMCSQIVYHKAKIIEYAHIKTNEEKEND